MTAVSHENFGVRILALKPRIGVPSFGAVAIGCQSLISLSDPSQFSFYSGADFSL